MNGWPTDNTRLEQSIRQFPARRYALLCRSLHNSTVLALPVRTHATQHLRFGPTDTKTHIAVRKHP